MLMMEVESEGEGETSDSTKGGEGKEGGEGEISDGGVTPQAEVATGSEEDKPPPAIRPKGRKRRKRGFASSESDAEWTPAALPRRSTRKRKIRTSRYSSDEENAQPAKKRIAYLKKYRKLKESRNFTCHVCDKKFVTATHLKEHLESHCQCFPCQLCGKVFNHSRSLQRHLKAGHEGGGGEEGGEDVGEMLDCSKTETPEEPKCRKYYEGLKTERKFQCDECNKCFITSGHLSTHKYCHSDRRWNCEGCDKEFSCERSLLRHKDTFPGAHFFPCRLCDMTFFRLLNIVKHMEIKHPEAALEGEERLGVVGEGVELSQQTAGMLAESSSPKIYVCAKCLKVFYSYEGLQVHKQAMHGSKKELKATCLDQKEEDSLEGKHQCGICGKEFLSVEGYEYHRIHQHVEKEQKRKKKRKKEDEKMEKKTFVCKICLASFDVKAALQTHLKTHNVTKNVEVRTGAHQCCICPRSFTSSDGLKYHLATHTGERRYSCNQCGKKFIKKTHLSEHIATHSEVKYFKCSRCPRTFSTHSAYRKHLKQFPGPHSFPCLKCGKLFTKESMIEKHMCVDLVKITMAPEVKALLSEDMIEEYLCIAEEELDGTNSQTTCYKCFKVFPSLEALQTHQVEHIGKQNYPCRFCAESFKRADAFGAHIRDHLGSAPYMCLKCNRKFISPFTLSMHAKNYPGDHSFTCHKCLRWFPSEKRLEKHDCILQNSDTFVCACSLNITSWHGLLEHAGSKPYKCCSCNLQYPTLMALARHIKKHTGVKPFACDECDKTFRSKSNYLNHKKVHRSVEEVSCEHCEYKTKSRKRLDFHLLRKHDIGSNSAKSTLCPICGIIFPYLSQLKRHSEQEHGEPRDEGDETRRSLPSELCTLCGKMLNNKYTLANHMRKVHDPSGGKKTPEVKCSVCGEKFRTLKRLQRHSEVHEVPGPRNCEMCHKEFYHSKDLRKHMRRHDTNKPYSCTRCGKHFKVSVSLKYHSTICRIYGDRPAGSRRRREAPPRENHEMEFEPTHHTQPLDLQGRQFALHNASIPFNGMETMKLLVRA